jgi:hypothetical protein
MKVDQARERSIVTYEIDSSDDLFYGQILGFSFTNSPNWIDIYSAILKGFWYKSHRAGTRLLWEDGE